MSGSRSIAYGFSVQQPRFQFRLIAPEGGPTGMTVSFWARSGSRIEQAVVWKSDRLMLSNMKEHKWIGGRAVRLGLDVRVDTGSDSFPEKSGCSTILVQATLKPVALVSIIVRL